MFHPVGSQPPSIYWRRRLLVVGSIVLLIVLLVLTVKVAAGGDTKTNGGGGPTPPTTHPAATSPNTITPPPGTTHAQTTAPASSTHAKSTAPTTPPPSPCVAKNLAVSAVVGQDSYSVGDDPVLEMQVTNTGAKPCVQDLADKQIVLSVYNGESRVWGSHDCQIQPGTDPKTLAVNTPVRVAINWSGLTSQPKCAGTRQRVGAGTYTLYATLSGKTGKATQFTIN